MKLKTSLFLLSYIVCINVYTQDIELLEQFNGRFDYVAIGNTLNPVENEDPENCMIFTSSSANLNLDPDQTIVAAYLYWAGSGTEDLDITLNGNAISAERTFNDNRFIGCGGIFFEGIFFAAFADITELVQSLGNTTYTIADLDLTTDIDNYCGCGLNFGGWALNVIYQQDSLPLNQVTVYDGLQSVRGSVNTITIDLTGLNVINNENARIGFIAWEGDRNLAVTEELTINGDVIGNPPLNPPDNAFNGTNSFTGQDDLFNMDIDVYNIENSISIGDTELSISLSSGQDFVMVNNITVVLNSQVPDASVLFESIVLECDSRDIVVNYEITNLNSNGILEFNTPIAFYADGILVGQSQTQSDIPIDGSETSTITLSIPNTIPSEFTLEIVVDDDGNSNSTILETDETNNSVSESIALLLIPGTVTLAGLTSCNIGFERGEFNLFDVTDANEALRDSDFQFFNTLEELQSNINPISNADSYINNTNPEAIFVRLEAPPCYEIFQFELQVENCPPLIPEGFSPNNDGLNDTFNIRGLYNIFVDHRLRVYNRYGTLIFEGNNNTEWSGKSNRGTNSGGLIPVGTYFYILNLNDPNYQPINGWVYVNY